MQELVNMTDITTVVLVIGTGLILGLLVLFGIIKAIDKIFEAAQPDDPSDPEPAKEDFLAPRSKDYFLAPRP